ncbi:Bacteriophage lambda head decoration protein D [Cohaesibacter sp. ES.047]|uniref:head decoration protein n=1 Tax=Cohaesibacter sp. ES.047 TaxID=1798205 RepID=UPI000BB7B31D|nr:head decoration protein [Cohaesibacter sp. ES.047]SNY94068.1 Bacteriophage lambda head decoration protein D [Cohaesibacter sp. ES.047]
MTTYVEGARNAEFLISEAEHYRSREAGDVNAGADTTLEAGAILGKITATNVLAQYDPAANDGTESVHGILFERLTGTGVRTYIRRAAQVKAGLLVWKTGLSPAQITTGTAELEALGVIVR